MERGTYFISHDEGPLRCETSGRDAVCQEDCAVRRRDDGKSWKAWVEGRVEKVWVFHPSTAELGPGPTLAAPAFPLWAMPFQH